MKEMDKFCLGLFIGGILSLMVTLAVLSLFGFFDLSSPSGPGHSQAVITPGTPALTFNDLLDAIEWVESRGDPWAVGDNGNAVGAYQIHKIYVDDVNRIAICGRFKYSERTDKDISRKMTYIYLRHYGGTFEEMARKHNGGPNGHKKESTKAYWLRVKARMEAK